MLVIKETEQGYKVKHLFSEYSDVTYEDYGKALELCALRCHKSIYEDELIIIKVPFIHLWIVW